jgi:hypothetical protein
LVRLTCGGPDLIDGGGAIRNSVSCKRTITARLLALNWQRVAIRRATRTVRLRLHPAIGRRDVDGHCKRDVIHEQAARSFRVGERRHHGQRQVLENGIVNAGTGGGIDVNTSLRPGFFRDAIQQDAGQMEVDRVERVDGPEARIAREINEIQMTRDQ